ncbi:histidine phosphatase superfamily [Pavlovales sp. CCMP2436]|nr:histidine phosphatase superfamily [Pavlovales sp. CCMP2436]|mmetsp:Transcript_15397/g.39054  ORF Transcript_15397/g.39054 Transcript_15397/m.39054 type:complete len:272 (+) Transcript_15397:77-892(+)
MAHHAREFAVMAADETTLYLVRHGDRFDYANEDAWAAASKRVGFEHRDPPLSALGHQQAREVALKLMNATSGCKVDRLLVSPYLRVIQTAQPFAHASNLQIEIEEGLAEVCHAPSTIPSAEARFPIFPEVSLSYRSALSVATGAADSAGRPSEIYPLDYLRRNARFAQHISKNYAGKTVVCFSHAASVALVAALTQQSIVEANLKMAPCGIFKLVGRAGSAWRMEMHGGDNTTHISINSPTTFPWGFADSRSPAIHETWASVVDEMARTSI